jgi:hypothetical protein
MTKMILQRSFFTGLNFLKLFLKKNGVVTHPLKKNFMDLALNIIIMIILKPGQKFFFTRLP